MTPSITQQVSIRTAVFPADSERVGELFVEYAQSLPIPLDFQGFEEELARLPGKYAVEQGGAVFLACTDSLSGNQDGESASRETIIGIVALRSFPTASTPTCELKRLYVVPSGRRLGLSKKLMDAVIAKARGLGYKEMLLDRLGSMTAAKRLYEGYGFVEIESYYQSVEDAVLYKLVL